MEISKICPVCHQSFKAKRSTHVYCCSYYRKNCERLYWKHKKNKDKNLF